MSRAYLGGLTTEVMMGFFNSIAGSLINPINLAQLAMGPAGWASIAMRTIGAQIGMNLIQRLGQELGLPQPMIDMAQSAFASSAGLPGLAQQNLTEAVAGLGFNPAQEGQLARGMDDAITSLVNEAVKRELGFEDEDGGKRTGASAAQGRADFFTRFAEMMGKKLNDGFEALERKSDATDWKDAQAVTEFQAEQQKFSFFMNSVSTAIKAVGEALNNMARKQ
ncbi:MAG: hypothetical protein AAF707_04215 [Pseudomonadota bacterium]